MQKRIICISMGAKLIFQMGVQKCVPYFVRKPHFRVIGLFRELKVNVHEIYPKTYMKGVEV